MKLKTCMWSFCAKKDRVVSVSGVNKAALSRTPCFYMLFHFLLNITAEFTGFGDREFYLVCLIAMSLTVCTADVTASMCSNSPGML